MTALSCTLAALVALAPAQEEATTPLRQFHQQTQDGDLWATTGVYVGSAALVSGIFAGPGTAARVLRGSLPLAAGITAVNLMRGRSNPRDLAVSALAYGVGGLVVTLLADGMILPMLWVSGPMGWGVAALYSVGKFAVGTYLGTVLEKWIMKDPDGLLLQEQLFGKKKGSKGVKPKIDAIAP